MQKIRSKEGGEGLRTLKKEKEELESELSRESLQNQQLKQELAEAENRNADLVKVISHHYHNFCHLQSIACLYANDYEIRGACNQLREDGV